MADGRGDFKLIKAARLIDGSGAPPLERGAVLMEGSVIRAVGTEEAVVPPEGADKDAMRNSLELGSEARIHGGPNPSAARQPDAELPPNISQVSLRVRKGSRAREG